VTKACALAWPAERALISDDIDGKGSHWRSCADDPRSTPAEALGPNMQRR
jgi:hypothetical protein